MNLKVSNLFAQPKTPEGLDEMLDNLFGKGTPERGSAELVKGFTVNLIAHMFLTGSITIGCPECEIEKPTGDLLCYDCARPGAPT